MPVYFIQAGETGPVKIGSSLRVASRLASMQPHCWEKLRLIRLFNGYAVEEGSLHARFRQHRLRGEWYRPVEEIIDGVIGLEPLAFTEAQVDYGANPNQRASMRIEPGDFFPNVLDEWRRQSGLSVKDYAARVGIHAVTLGSFLSGCGWVRPSVRTLHAMCGATGGAVTVDQVWRPGAGVKLPPYPFRGRAPHRLTAAPAEAAQ